jgi:hypothetical protein
LIVKHIGVWSAARIYAIISAGIGLFIGLCIALLSLIGGAAAAANSDMPSWVMPIFGVGSIVVFPILYGVMGLIGGAIGAALFNFGARLGGGLQIDVQ